MIKKLHALLCDGLTLFCAYCLPGSIGYKIHLKITDPLIRMYNKKYDE